MHGEEGGGSPAGQRTDSDKSFVKKVTSRVSGFIPTSLTKWFGSSEGPKVRHRDDLEEDEEAHSLQPPTKRAKLPTHDSPALNFASTPLHGAHLTYTGLMPDPAPGPSGVKSRKLVLPDLNLSKQFSEQTHGLQNGDKDSDSGESTSGYSSMPRIPSKEQVSEIGDKSCLTPSKTSNRSLFSTSAISERSLFTNHKAADRLNTSLSSRRPSFNTSAFRSPNFMDRTLSTKRIIDSPFYGGRTTYGGASAYSRNSMKPSSEPNSCLRNFVQAKPVTEAKSSSTTLSKTARRILSTLEQYADPSEDVKRIPNPASSSRRGLQGRPYSARESRSASNKELLVPTMSDLLKMKMREQLQDSTVSVRELATTSKSHLNVEEYKIREAEETPVFTKNTNKIKTKITSTRQKPAEAEEPAQPVLLPEVPLPISTLPSFDFTIPSPAVSKPSVEKKTALLTPNKTAANVVEAKPSPPSKSTTATQSKRKDFTEFIFSKPLVLAENMKSIKAINNFKFSEPVNKRRLAGEAFKTFGFTPATNVALKKVARKNNGENGVPCVPAKELMTSGSVMDVLGKKNDLLDKFKPAEGTWECKMCMIRNTAEKKRCVACETPKETTEQKKAPQPTAVSSSSFGDKFKISSGQWECSVCMIRNDPAKSKCAACETPKQQTPAKPVNNCTDFGDKFKITTDKWECSVCMVRNDSAQSACVACTTARKTAAVSKWECGVCMVMNAGDKTRCVCCENPKPGCKSEPVAKKKTSSDWECSTCLVKNPDSKLKCFCCETAKPGSAIVGDSAGQFKFGIDLTQTNGHGFTFGIKPDMKSQSGEEPAKTGSSGFTFGAKAPVVEAAPTTTFSFGLPAAQTPKSLKRASEEGSGGGVKKSAPQQAAPVNGDAGKPVSFGVPAAAALSFGASPKVEAEKPAPKPSFGAESKPTLTFGATTCLNTTNTTNTPATTTPNFGSAAPAAAENKPTFTFNAPMAKTDSATAAAAAAPAFSFGAPSANKPQPTTTVPAKTETAAPPAYKFNSTTTSSSSNTTFNFSPANTATATKPTTSGFSFSSAAPASESRAPAPAPAFGATTSAVFGSASAEKFAAPAFGAPSGGFGGSFGSPAAPAAAFGTPAAAQAPAFGAAAQQPAQNGVFNFGAPAASATPKSGFNFGASPAAPSAGGFNFGASSNNTQGSAGFKFSAPSATPQFNADLKPSFNFTAGTAPNTFTAQPSGETPKPTQRVIRKALRRTHR